MQMQWMTLIAGTVTVVVSVCVTWRWVVDRFTQREDADLADTLIAHAGAKPVQGMEEPDWRLINRLGQRTWEEALRAQRRHRDQHPHPAPAPLRRIA